MANQECGTHKLSYACTHCKLWASCWLDSEERKIAAEKGLLRENRPPNNCARVLKEVREVIALRNRAYRLMPQGTYTLKETRHPFKPRYKRDKAPKPVWSTPPA